MENRLNKLTTYQVKKVYCKMMKIKNTSLKKDKIVSKLLAPLQKKYRMGLGDLIEWFTKKTGIKWLVEKIWGKDCGCDKRKEKANQVKLW